MNTNSTQEGTQPEKAKRRLHEQFPDLAPAPRIEVLDIPDDYEFMAPALIELIRASVEPLLEPAA